MSRDFWKKVLKSFNFFKKNLLTDGDSYVIISHVVARYAGVAQSAEQLICNQQVTGSIPATSSTLFFLLILKKGLTEAFSCGILTKSVKYGGVPEWPKGADCKSVAFSFDGSNPSPSTNFLARLQDQKPALLGFLF